MENIWAFCIFAFVASITPGPTNLLILTTSHRYGFNKAIPIVLGASLGAALLVLLIGLGIGQNIQHYPLLKLSLSLLGGLWLTSVAWKIYNSHPNIHIDLDDKFQQKGFIHGFILQLINPKSWLMGIAVVTVYLTNSHNYEYILIVISTIFMLIAIPCLFMWALLGKAVTSILSSHRQIIVLNRILAIGLLVSVWYPIFSM
ncbi:LysE family transporter [Acinetobacter sichuanensis]|uniref:LysE family translocator n=1 Tax=Acinetobacter sichuanensis TaxID=2136183 RepID=UPI00280E98D2|nr:LysE family transporter [Acinetobacter sichuanensis]MDQ9021853.1 LysE family transporter [Acinetobacter sichuanensis]